MATLDPVAFTQDLIRCPSVTPAEGGALDLLQRVLEGMGFACERLRFSEAGTPDVDNLYARIGQAGPNFCFAGHTDVVPVGTDWSVDPFAGDVREGLLYGRGAADMKGAIAAFVAAAARHLAKGPLAGSVSLLITGDEEGPAINGTRKVLEHLAARGEALDVCVVGEPTNPTVLGEMMKIGRRGSMNAVITAKGVAGHVAYPHLADNAAHRMVALLHALTAEPLDQGSEHFQPSSLQITTIDIGNATTNVIPADATARINIRFNDLHSSDSLKAWIEARLKAAAGDGNYSVAYQVSGESFYTQPGALSDLLAGSVAAVTGRQPELSTSGGTSDARFIRAYCPVAEFGLVGQTMHKADERVAVADIRMLADIYETMLDRFFRSR